jgi:4-hydroxybenzoate polyprenyltransferase
MSDMAPPPVAAPSGEPSSNAKLIALLGWIFAPFGLIAIFLDDYKNDMFVRSNTIQAAALWLAGYVLGFVLSFFLIGFIVFPIVFIIQIIFGIQAFGGKTPEVPVIYGMVKSFIEQTS